MDKQQDESKSEPVNNKNTLSLVCLLALLALGAVVIQLTGRVEELSAKLESQTQNTQTADDAVPPVISTTVESGKGGFTMNVPNGWGPMIKDINSDFFIMVGQAQPTVKAGAKTEIIKTEGYGSDSASVFMAMLSDEGMGDVPQGTVEEFTIGKAEDELVGKKYSYIYPKDDIVGIGYLRPQNDRDYLYTFTLSNGKRLDVTYHVYGSDPRNQVEIVDAIVQSIVVKR